VIATRRRARHAIWFLILFGRYAYGDHVLAAEAFNRRARGVLLDLRTRS
jgi:hypothetical protein